MLCAAGWGCRVRSSLHAATLGMLLAGMLLPVVRLPAGMGAHLFVRRQVAVGLPHNVLPGHRGVVRQAVGGGPLVRLDGCRGGQRGGQQEGKGGAVGMLWAEAL